eukprot:CAMPEP_0197038084 /NCGR_PEP_ID=MMETSP1384-20130603/15113_1 /TAXON_ID=29189 /ORGANISM="Ammonia sp." /LENGTH=419 /DNA_ID=CAMNT_0042468477 /DNA_START=26 /DNA_END=1285 /DNA_ORIENTATION=-
MQVFKAIKVKLYGSHLTHPKEMPDANNQRANQTVKAQPENASTASCSPCKRSVFLNIQSFHDSWRLLSSDILCDSLLILPHFHSQWIIHGASQCDDIPANVKKMLTDPVFSKLLQWKYEQGLVFCMLNSAQTVSSWNLPPNKTGSGCITSFWHHLNDKLCELADPSTFKTSTHNALIFDFTYYTSPQFRSKYNVKASDIVYELCTQQEQRDNVIREILYQSNPSLNLLLSVDELNETEMDATKLTEHLLEQLMMSTFVVTDAVSSAAEEEKAFHDGLDDIFNDVRKQWAAEQSSVLVDDELEPIAKPESSTGTDDVPQSPSFIEQCVRSLALRSAHADGVARMLPSRSKGKKARKARKAKQGTSASHAAMICQDTLSPVTPVSPGDHFQFSPRPRDSCSLLQSDGWWVADEYYDDELQE